MRVETPSALELLKQVDAGSDQKRDSAIHQRSSGPVTRRRPPRCLRKAAGVRANDAGYCQRMLAVRHLVRDTSPQRPTQPIDRPATGTRRVVEWPMHCRCQGFRRPLLNDELANVRRGAATVSIPAATPLWWLVAELIDFCIGQPEGSPVYQIASKPIQAR